ncbi:hypothetical protein B0H13DRAFT_2269843 [Mycena leptocephala]|nr:hypothetical protein B0H13DRAFT_2279779 [Mycena leptocephala]KAJ7916599.1 hypothetical protein B0H13DRAFT_2269843 [Mycena leptocephala]
MADKYYHAQSMPNADRRTFTILIYSVTGPQTRRPISSFQADSSVSAQFWVPGQITLSAYLGFQTGTVELVTLINLGFDSNPTRVVLVQPSGDMITNVAYKNNIILFINLSHLVTFMQLGPNPVSETLHLTDLLQIWAENEIQTTRVRDYPPVSLYAGKAIRKPRVQEGVQNKGRESRPTSFRDAWKAAFGSDYASDDELTDIEEEADS